MIDFDAKFQTYYENWIKENTGKYTYDELEEKVSEVYEQWLNTPESDLSGDSPLHWVEKLSLEQLLDVFMKSFETGLPSSLVTEQLLQNKDGMKILSEIIADESRAEQIRLYIANMMIEAESVDLCENVFVSWLKDSNCSAELKEVSVEALTERANAVKDSLLNFADSVDADTKTLLVEILINAEKDDRTYNLLADLFKNGNDRALYAGYIAKYGDERFAPMLYKALDDCNYLEFTEIRNAIETLGGVVDDEYRNFSEDEYYKAIKNLK